MAKRSQIPLRLQSELYLRPFSPTGRLHLADGHPDDSRFFAGSCDSVQIREDGPTRPTFLRPAARRVMELVGLKMGMERLSATGDRSTFCMTNGRFRWVCACEPVRSAAIALTKSGLPGRSLPLAPGSMETAQHA